MQHFETLVLTQGKLKEQGTGLWYEDEELIYKALIGYLYFCEASLAIFSLTLELSHFKSNAVLVLFRNLYE
jgi:hypothetical protein